MRRRTRDRDLGGTRFRLFAQAPFLRPDDPPDIVQVSAPPGSLAPGPADERMFVIDPIGKQRPYGFFTDARGQRGLYLPPWDGPVRPPVEPSADGHFDHIEPDAPGFEVVHAFGAVHFVQDIWESYFGRPISWHFGGLQDPLEIVHYPHFDNAHAGYGFLELGADFMEDGEVRPFSLDFDIIAHEVGHLIIYSVIGIPHPETEEGEYFGFHESAADLVTLLSVLHFESVVDRLLNQSRGNLYTYNELNRFAELSENTQIRLASNSVKLSEFADGWKKEHQLSEPLTGAMFDIFVDIFHESLLDRRLISPEVEDLADQLQRRPDYADAIQVFFDEAYPRDPAGFKIALLEARDYLGTALARTWERLSPHYLNYDDVGAALLEVDRELTGGRYRRLIVNNFRWREIGDVTVGPRLSPPDSESHAFSDRTATPQTRPRRRRRSYNQRWRSARRSLLSG